MHLMISSSKSHSRNIAMALPRKYTLRKPPYAPSNLHPPYFQMISEAITSMKDRNGSSQPAIAKFVEAKYRKFLPPNFKKILSVQLKKAVKSEKLIKVKNSYKVSAPKSVAKSTNRTRTAGKKSKNASVVRVPNKKGSKANDQKATKKMKRLSQVKKTPEVSKTNSRGWVRNVKGSVTGAKMKRLSQSRVKTPESLKKKTAASFPVKKTEFAHNTESSKSLKSTEHAAKRGRI